MHQTSQPRLNDLQNIKVEPDVRCGCRAQMNLDEMIKRLEEALIVNSAMTLQHQERIKEHDESLRDHELAMQAHNRAMQQHNEAMAKLDEKLDRFRGGNGTN
jgi:hypothetical protein